MRAPRELLARVAAHPDALEARLACAQALLAHDAPRAELIQAQVALTERGWLALNRNGLTDEAAEVLAGSEVLVNLQRLELVRHELSEEGALAFRSKTALPKLRLLELRDMALSARQLEPLLKRLGWGVKL